MASLKTNIKASPVTAFAAKLAAVFADANITPEFYKIFGENVAQQQVPERHIPYGEYTVKAWLEGSLLPTPLAFEAMTAELDEWLGANNKTKNAQEQLEGAWEVACEWQAAQKHQPTELSHALLVAKGRMGLRDKELAHKALEENKKRKEKSTLLRESRAGWSLILGGLVENTPSKQHTYAMQHWFNAHCKDSPATQPIEPTLLALHEQALRERGDGLWENAVREESLGGMIHAIRARRGESCEDFGAQLARIAGRKTDDAKDNAFAGFAVFSWENNTKLPKGDQYQTKATLCEPLIMLAKITDVAPNGLVRSIKGEDDKGNKGAAPWFTREREQLFRQTFARAVQKSNESHFSVKMPSLMNGDAPEMRDVRPEVKVMGASLAGNLVNGCAKKAVRE